MSEDGWDAGIAPPGEWECYHCRRGDCARCKDADCSCCAGNED